MADPPFFVPDPAAIIELDDEHSYYKIGAAVFRSFADAKTAGVAFGTSFQLSEWDITGLLDDSWVVQYWFTNPATPVATSAFNCIVMFDDNAGTNTDYRVSIVTGKDGSGNPYVNGTITNSPGSIEQANINRTADAQTGGTTAGGPTNGAFQAVTNNSRIAGNARVSNPDTSCIVPQNFKRLRIGHYADGSRDFSAVGGSVQRIAVYGTVPATSEGLRYLSERIPRTPDNPGTHFIPAVAGGNGGPHGPPAVDANGFIYFGWCDHLGVQGIDRVSPAGIVVERKVIATRYRLADTTLAMGSSDHLIPAPAFDADGRLIVAYTGHNNSTFPNIVYQISPTGLLQDLDYAGIIGDESSRTATYPRLFTHAPTGDIYLIARFTDLRWGLMKLAAGSSTFAYLATLIVHSAQCYTTAGWVPGDPHTLRMWTNVNSELDNGASKLFHVNVVTGAVSIEAGVQGNIYSPTALPMAASAVPNWYTPAAGFTAGQFRAIDGDHGGLLVASNDSQTQYCLYCERTGANPYNIAHWTLTNVGTFGTYPFYGDGRRAGGFAVSLETGLAGPRVWMGETDRSGTPASKIQQWDRAGGPGAPFTLTRTVASSVISGFDATFWPTAIPSDRLPLCYLTGYYEDYNKQAQSTYWETPLSIDGAKSRAIVTKLKSRIVSTRRPARVAASLSQLKAA